MPRPFLLPSLLATVCVAVATSVAAPRPPSKGQASALLYEGLDGGADTPGARYLSTLSETERLALKRDGRVIRDQQNISKGHLVAVVRFDRSMAEVYAVLSHPSDQASFLPNVTKSKTFGSRTDEAEQVDYEVSVLFTVKFRTQHWYYPEQHRIEWCLDPTGEAGLQEQSGSWQLYKLDELTTVAEYTTRVVVRSSIFNAFRGLGERGGLTESLQATRKHVHTKEL